MKQNSPESAKCSTCGSMRTAITDPESAEVICNGCGMVISDTTMAAQEMESRVSGNNGDGTSAPLSRHDRGLATIIGSHNVDASGKKLDSNTSLTFERLRTWDARTQIDSSIDRNLARAFSELLMLKDKLGLSDAIVEKTAYIYRKVVVRRLVRGRTIPGMLAACLYLSCRETGTPRTIKDISSKSNIKRKDIARSIRLIILEFDIRAPIFDPMKCIAKIANISKVSEKTKRQAFDIMNMANRSKISAGKDPMALAASILYIACKETAENKTQRDMAKAAGVTEVTIRNRVRDLGRNLHFPAAI
jgi:transcription initiation factor TFIIB